MVETRRIVIASNNAGKLKEIRAILQDLPVAVIPQTDYGIEDAEESGLTFVENAIIKARHAAAHTGLAAIADDSGIEVDVLNGKPGIHSARFAGAGASDAANLQLLLHKLKPHRDGPISARFQCVMVYLRHDLDPTPLIAQASWEGSIIAEPRGAGGFGYDPVFLVPGHDCTSAELPARVKNRISHRGQALRSLLGQLSAILG